MKETHKLTIYLIKNTVVAFNSCLRLEIEANLTKYELKEEFNIEGVIYVAVTQNKDSKWHRLIQQGTSKDIPKLTNASNRAILFVKIEERIFALTFGYGQYLLNPAAIERNFGLKTSLNIIEQDKLRSMDKAKLDELTVQTRIQSSITTDRGSFNIDVIGDLLRSITGESSDKSLGNSITGTDALYINPKVEFGDLKPTVQNIKRYHALENYKENFDWIDNLEHEKNAQIIDDLTESLVNDIKDKNQLEVSIAPPYILDWSSFNGISFTPKGDLISDFDIVEYYKYKDDFSEFSIDKLKSSYLYIEDSGSENRISISLLKCLNYQTELNGNLYVRTLGKWYRISKIFSDQIFEETSRIKESDAIYLDCQKDWNEGEYNEALANLRDEHTLFDKKLIRCESTRSSIEACDVLTRSGEFIHVKPKNSSSTLSHLFAQGRISAIALNSDKKFRKEMRKTIRSNGDFSDDVIPLEKINNSDFKVTYATITKGDIPMVKKLPFFSLLNLRQSAQFLSEHGFEVRVKKIKKLEE